ncbi:hypothetical protein NSK11_contig00100-0017 [Nocardia seriolae]|uniref:Uncharacterized protein n=1 Tax=Nocardia seriolae TaxID=37332 RepID=A0ABC9YZW3_9NOCA|nr:hypothetical protein NSERKGN1266_12170 [Nocardia seriolae]BEK98896.1 hypothetical protein NSER024013_68020 [Nocardia seriolae]GAM49064.1 hypothetical protein NS07_v2contig00095-0017 [Nocardia seriolae]GAP30988.1 hypothetical protein NSK11_contig00100-0017 [Nocardia seriolae]GEM26636.1 hypothetical protein NS2_48750 [Nocardia seriolae NBRC 15557]
MRGVSIVAAVRGMGIVAGMRRVIGVCRMVIVCRVGTVCGMLVVSSVVVVGRVVVVSGVRLGGHFRVLSTAFIALRKMKLIPPWGICNTGRCELYHCTDPEFGSP